MKQFPNIPGYKIEQQLARGRIADVYLAVRRNTNERVIVKVLKSELLGEQRFATQLLVEAGKAASKSSIILNSRLTVHLMPIWPHWEMGLLLGILVHI